MIYKKWRTKFLCFKLWILIAFSIQHIKCQYKTERPPYEDFLNYGTKKIKAVSGLGKLENEIIKSKVEVLGEVLKKHVNKLRKSPGQIVELVFLVDSSASVGAENFFSEVKFVKKLLADFTVSFNQTRVAVITFSSENKVIRQIDHVTHASILNHKCSLLGKELHTIEYSGGGTYTLGALREAQSVLALSRADAVKAVFLVTDGYSNGGDPRPAAEFLKNRGVILFTFGIHNGNVKELYDMASEPKEEHSYILNSFQEFEALARRALHEDLHNGLIIAQESSACSILCEEGLECCDEYAKCSCGAHTGNYACTCRIGYYGTGLKGDCTPCPAGTYRDEEGPSDIKSCKTCPDPNMMSSEGSISPNHCYCKKGFIQDGLQCRKRQCPPLMPPSNGYFVREICEAVVNAACGIRCRTGYALEGSSIRLCRPDGTWSGGDSKCIAKTCQTLKAPLNGNMICSSKRNTIDTQCHFMCKPGFLLVGSKMRTCLPLAMWDGIKGYCKPIHCNPLPPIRNGLIKPEPCTIAKNRFGTRCEFGCNQGYQLSGPLKSTCGDKGLWSKESSQVKCIDVEPPSILCPQDLYITTKPKENFAYAAWDHPTAKDSSLGKVFISTIPATKQPMKLKIGKHTIIYVAQDEWGNRAKCNMLVHVRDEEPPQIDRCESPPTFLSEEPEVEVDWEEPLFSDNSDSTLQIKRTKEPGRFLQGETIVEYTATDASGNSQSCNITVKVQKHACDIPSDPNNGLANCSENSDAIHCSLLCEEGYAMTMKPKQDYFCAYDGIWQPGTNPSPFPDCSASVISNAISQSGEMAMEEEGASICDDIFLMGQIEKNIQRKLESALSKVCKNEFLCEIAAVEAVCEDLLEEVEEQFNSISYSRRKRSVGNSNAVKSRFWPNDFNSISYLYWTRGAPVDHVFKRREKRDLTKIFALDKKEKSRENNTANFMGILTNILIRNFGKNLGTSKLSKFLLKLKIKDGTFEVKDFLTEFIKEFGEAKSKTLETLLKERNLYRDKISLPLKDIDNATDKSHVQIHFNSSTINEFNDEVHNESFNEMTRALEFSINNENLSGIAQINENELFNSTNDNEVFSGSDIQQMLEFEGSEKSLFDIANKTSDISAIVNYNNSKTKNTIKVKFSVEGRGRNVNKVMQNAFKKVLQLANDGNFDFDFGERQLKIAAIRLSEDPTYLCEVGSVLVDKLCVKCPIGTFFNVIVRECQQCPPGSYQPEEGQVSCLVCPENTSTRKGVARTKEDCKAMCLPGSFSNDTLEPCITCSLGEYQDQYASMSCLPCPQETTTWRRGAWLISECKPACSSGFVSENGLVPCFSCPKGYFQDKQAQRECYKCPEDMTTNDINSTSLLDCIGHHNNSAITYDNLEVLPVNDCFSNPCHNHGSCVAMESGYSCSCLAGFTGQDCEAEIDECLNQPCLNNGTCEDMIGSFQCFCLSGFKGQICEVNIDDCEPNPCSNNDTCIDLVDTFKCICEPGYSGETCDINIDDCLEAPCSEQSTCIDEITDYKCICPPGFEGRHCNIDVDECDSAPCIHGTCLDLINDFTCSCEDGYTGKRCEVNIDDCESSPCMNNATCTDWLKGFSCHCPPAYTGQFCEKLMSTDFVLTFPDTGIINYASVENLQRNLSSVTVCLWMKSADKEHYGTPFSYATHSQDNAFTLTDYTGFVFYIVGEKRVTDVSANDDKWHMICVTWASSNGSWVIYKDGEERDSGMDLGTNKTIEANGVFVIGQEQDQRGGGYSTPESFVGEMTLLNIWDRTLSNSEIKELYHECDRYDGNLKSWPDFQAGLMGQVKSRISSFCVGCEGLQSPKFGNYLGGEPYSGSKAKFTCNHGYKLFRGSKERHCLISGEWSGEEPECRPISCGIPGQIKNGNVFGTSYTFGDTIRYTCKIGFKLVGNRKRTCMSTGKWNGKQPECHLIECSLPEPIDNGKIVTPLESYLPTNRATYICDNGYQRDGPAYQECSGSGDWQGGKPSCQAKSCSILPRLDHATLINITTESDPNIKLRVKCNSRFKLEGSSSFILCKSDGTWEKPFPKCIKKKCEKPPPLKNGNFRIRVSFKGRQVKYKCNYGYYLEGEDLITCKDGSWGITDWPKCLPFPCPTPDVPEHGEEFESKRWVVGDKLQYKCKEGYALSGNPSNLCKSSYRSGFWEGDTPKCEIITCPPLKPIDGGKIRIDKNVDELSDTTSQSIDNRIKSIRQHHYEHFGKPSSVYDYLQPRSLFLNQESFPVTSGFLDRFTFKPTISPQSVYKPVLFPRNNHPTTTAFPIPNVHRRPRNTLNYESQKIESDYNYEMQSNDYDYINQNVYGFGDNSQISDDEQLITNQNVNQIHANSLEISSPHDDDNIIIQDINSSEDQSHIYNVDFSQTQNSHNFYSTQVYNTIAQYECKAGYKLLGSKIRQCSENGEWDNPVPRCYEMHCPELKALENGIMSYFGSGSYSEVEFKCKDGYKMEGNSRITCLLDRSWSESIPQCNPLYCEIPAKPENGTISYSSITYGSIASYECDPGFILEGSFERHCGMDGFWNGSLPRCIGIVCKTPSVIEKGYIYYEGNLNVGSTVEYGCDDCYKLNGTDIRKCQMNETWTLEEPKCEIVYCEKIKTIENGIIIGEDNYCGAVIQYKCNPGYELKGETQRTCMEEGVWINDSPTCEKISCGNPPNIPHSKYTAKSYLFLDKVTYTCDEGYILNGDDTLTCSETRKWMGIIPECLIINCTKPKGPSNGRVRVNGLFYGASVMVVCDPGFKLVGNGSLSCTADGKWDKDIPFCAPVVCPAAPTPKYSSYNSTEVYFESFTQLKYECETGYYTNQNNTHLICDQKGSWDGQIIKCQPINCGKPEQFKNGLVDGNMFTFGYVIDFSCSAGYELIGDEKATCQANGFWSSLPKCERIVCGPPKAVKFGRIKINEYEYDFNSSFEYQCDDGYVLTGSKTISCGKDAKWRRKEGLTQCTPVLCPEPERSIHIDIIGNIFEFNHSITYKCQKGYVLRGESVLMCQSDGTWSSEFPVCDSIICESPREIKNGIWKEKFRTDIPLLSEAVTNHVKDTKISKKYGQILQEPSELSSLLQYQFDGLDKFIFRLGHIIEYLCHEGYFKLVSGITECTENGWSSPPPECYPIKCPNPVQIRNGIVKGDDSLLGAKIKYSCNDGYKLIGVRTRICQSTQTWSGEQPYCQLKQCFHPSNLLNGEIIGRNNTYQSIISYSCNYGFRLIGSSTRVCQSNEKWSGDEPFCLEIFCEEPVKVPYALIDMTELKVGSRVNYECIEGYRMKGSASLKCQADGKWDQAAPRCLRTDCGPLVVDSHGNISTNSTVYATKVTFSCIRGYNLYGSAWAHCKENGKWSQDPPVCRRVNCEKLEEPENGYITGAEDTHREEEYSFIKKGKKTKFGKIVENVAKWADKLKWWKKQYEKKVHYVDDEIIFNCDPGWEIVGPHKLICNQDGKWSDHSPHCKRKACSKPTIPKHSHYKKKDYHFGDEIKLSCDQGYLLKGDPIMHCLEDGQWSSKNSSCDPVYCGPTIKIPNSEISYVLAEHGLSHHYGSAIRYSCLEGFVQEGSAYLSCESNGKWVGPRDEPPICIELSCPFPPPLQNGKIVEVNKAQKRAVYSCIPGYYLSGRSAVYCSLGKWRGFNASCSPVRCQEPQDPEHGRKIGNDFTFGKIVNYTCDYGYESKGESSIECGPTGKWLGATPECHRVDCGTPEEIPYGGIHFNSTLFNENAEYFCRKGYKLEGEKLRICNANKTWMGHLAKCTRIKCEKITPPVNGYVIGNGKHFQQTVSFACNIGYALVGSHESTCLSNGSWSTLNMECKSVNCSEPPPSIINGKLSLYLKNQTSVYGEKYFYSCLKGYIARGDLSTQCLSTGTWSHVRGKCSKISCGRPRVNQNGTVIIGRSFYFSDSVKVICPSGTKSAGNGILTCLENGTWSGIVSCDDLCSKTCQNGGVCLGKNICSCPSGFIGEKCEKAICILPCLNGGSCIRPYQCHCQPGYEGNRCQKPICENGCGENGKCIGPNFCLCQYGTAAPTCPEYGDYEDFEHQPSITQYQDWDIAALRKRKFLHKENI